ncbi:MAG: alpha/beta hydrolase-fold protein [Firmicutes bacterium]|nr:alpha/beta hydrolase-fold protein [Bacillota bacterium]
MSDVQSHGSRVIESHTLYSAQLAEERTVKVYLPPQVDAGSSLPVLYTHDGAEFFSHGRIATLAHERIMQGLIEPFIIVGIAVRHGFRTDDYAAGGDRNEAYRAFVTDTCIPAIEQLYPIDRTRRSMAGISLGASVTLQLFLDHKDLFRSLLLYSGAYLPSVQTRAEKETDLRKTKVWMVVGREETAVETASGTYNFLRINREMRDALQGKVETLSYTEAPGTHLWRFWQTQTPDALQFLVGKEMI